MVWVIELLSRYVTVVFAVPEKVIVVEVLLQIVMVEGEIEAVGKGRTVTTAEPETVAGQLPSVTESSE